jgi:hypothetical protein
MSSGKQKYKISWLQRPSVENESNRHGSAGCDRLALAALVLQ